MKFSRLFKLGKQGYNMYRSYKGKGQSHGSYKGYDSKSTYGGGSTLGRLVRRFLK